MTYLVILLLIILSANPISYAVYNWKNKNKLGAAGALLLAISAVFVPAVMLMLR